MTNKKIVIFHYHLKKGGITSVIKEQVKALKDDNRILLITGETPEEFIHENVSVIPELGYTGLKAQHYNVENVISKILDTVEKYFGTPCDIMHFHNPTLVKNHSIIRIIKMLASKGINILLQIHDFAEDGRPNSYAQENYPEDVHFGVINTRDYRYLLSSGLQEKGLHYIPNCVRSLETSTGEYLQNHLILYPVRAIRRKNIGEILLLSLFLDKDDYMGITLPALNANDLKSYEDWKLFSQSRNLRVEFDLGLKYSFNELVEKSKCFVTTSITEGFGFAFLESWISGRFLIGRRIREICQDFTDNGIELGHLYDKLLVPTELIDKTCFLNTLAGELNAASRYYGWEFDYENIFHYFKLLLNNALFDFGLLSEKLQADIITKVQENASIKDILYKANEKLALFSSPVVEDKLIAQNRAVVQTRYSSETYKKILDTVYSQVIAARVQQKIDKNILLSRFLQPEHIFMLKWGSYDRE